MASLNQVTKATRHILAIGTICIVGILVIIFLVNIGKAINESIHPTPPAPPTVSFGKLPAISFPDATITNTFSYNLDTISGNLPDFGDRATVYKMQPVQPNLLALNSAKDLVAQVGFSQDPQQISDTVYQWVNDDTLQKTLQLNIFTNNFDISSNYLTNQDVLQGTNLPDQNGAINTVTTYLQNFTLYPNDIDGNKTKATLFSITNGQLVPASSLSSTQIIRVDLFQADKNKLPIFYTDPTYSTMHMLVAGGSDAEQIVDAHFFHQEIGQDHATYPIITAQEAFDALKKGNVYIASYDNSGTNISIHNITLGYYIGETTQDYLEPIIVFQGNHGFFAYAPAITSEWVGN